MTSPEKPSSEKPWHVVRQSKVHGNGVFAARKIPEGTRIIEYGGKTISAKETDRRHPTNSALPEFFDQERSIFWCEFACRANPGDRSEMPRTALRSASGGRRKTRPGRLRRKFTDWG
jgi:hypothetical protein